MFTWTDVQSDRPLWQSDVTRASTVSSDEGEESDKFRVFSEVLPCSQIDIDRRFKRCVRPPSSGPSDGGSTHLWNVGRHRFDNTAVIPEYSDLLTAVSTWNLTKKVTAFNKKFRIVFWDVLSCKIIVDRELQSIAAAFFKISYLNHNCYWITPLVSIR
jgi:hypothetical protein